MSAIEFVALMWDWAWPIWGRILDGKLKSGLMLDLELWVGSPHPCRLRITLVGPCVTSIDYVLTHIEFMGSRKLSSFDRCRVGRYLISPIVMYTRIVYPWIVQCVVSCERRALGKGGIRPDSLIIVTNCGHKCGLGGLACVVLPGFPLHAVYWFESPRHMGDGLVVVSKRKSTNSIMFIWELC
jgi:hypothetical protein